jgi:hypothetical protein
MPQLYSRVTTRNAERRARTFVPRTARADTKIQ